MAAVGPDEQALAPSGERSTAFTGALLRVLRTGIAGAGEHLTVSAIMGAVAEDLVRRGLPRPELYEVNPRIELVRNAAFTTSAGSTPLRPRAGFVADGSTGEDRLGIGREVQTLCDIALAEDISPPLARRAVRRLEERQVVLHDEDA